MPSFSKSASFQPLACSHLPSGSVSCRRAIASSNSPGSTPRKGRAGSWHLLRVRNACAHPRTRVKDRPFPSRMRPSEGAESDPGHTQIDVDRLARLVQSHVSNAGKAMRSLSRSSGYHRRTPTPIRPPCLNRRHFSSSHPLRACCIIHPRRMRKERAFAERALNVPPPSGAAAPTAPAPSASSLGDHVTGHTSGGDPSSCDVRSR